MSTVAPNGQIRFLTEVPIDSNYENSLDFLSEIEQRTYFLGLQPVHTMIGATRVRDGVISVNMVADNLLHANYLMFQNMNFNNKWFYAFITDIEYVNNNMSYVYYQIDDIQTWMFDVQLKECFVEREHTLTDGMFEHLVDEGIGTSEYVSRQKYSKDYSRYVACLFISSEFNSEDEPVPTTISVKAGQLNGLGIVVYDIQNSQGDWLEPTYDGDIPTNDMGWLDYTIKKMTEKQQKDSILALITYPEHFSPANDTAHNPVTDTLQFTNFANGESLDGYVPKNKKLYNSPYCVFEFGTNDGQKEILQPEYLLDNDNGISIYSNCSPSPSLLCVPLWYENQDYCYKKALSIDDFPQAPISIDGYSAWVASGGLAKQMISSISGVANGALNVVGSTASGNSVGVVAGLTSAGTSIANTIVNIDVAKSLPAEVKGTLNSTPLSANRKIGLYVRKMTVNKDVAKSIDNYFTMFGYKVNKVKTPSRRNRPHYTYIKTKGCKVNGGAPADAIDRIQTIYDNGIRFWVNPAEVGNYTGIDNRPV